MSFRGITLEPIHKNIQIRLNELERMHSSKYPKPGLLTPTLPGEVIAPHDRIRLNSKTVWFSLRSNAGTENEEGDAYISPKFAHLRSSQTGEWFERSARKSTNPTMDNGTVDYTGGMHLTPPPGVESIGISTKGAMGSIKTADIKLRVFHPNDIAEIEKAYLMPGITLFLEWGWSGQTPIDSDTYEGMRGKEGSKKLEEMIIKRKLGLCESYSLIEGNLAAETTPDLEVADRMPGQYDAMLGVITKFNWTLDSDGSYGINISIISPNSLVMGVGLETHLLSATRNTGFIKKGDKYIASTKSVEQDGNLVAVPATVRTSVSDAEYLCRAMVKLLKGDGKQIMQYEVELGADAESQKKTPEARIKEANRVIKRSEDLLEYAEGDVDRAEGGLRRWAALSISKPNIGVEGWFISRSGEPITGVNMGGTVKKVKVPAIVPGGYKWAIGMTHEELNDTWDEFLTKSENKVAKYKRENPKTKKKQEAIIAYNEDLIEQLSKQKEEDAVAKSEGPSMGYTIEGEGSDKYVYFAMDPDSYFQTMVANMIYYEVEGKVFYKSRTCYGWHLDPTKVHMRNGSAVTYWWQEGAAKLDKGASLAYRAWVRKSDGNQYEKKNYVTWRWIEDYLLKQCSPKDNAGNPLISLNSTHIGSPADDQETAMYYPNQCLNNPVIQSMDYNICVLHDKQSKAAMESMKPLFPKGSEGPSIIGGEDWKIGDRFSPDEPGVSSFGNYSTGAIRDILVNIDHILKTLKSQRTFEGFVTTLLSDINDACGKPWDFTLQANEADAHVLQVVDKNCTPHAKSTLAVNPVIASMGSINSSGKWKVLESGGLSETTLSAQDLADVQITKPAQHYTFKGRGQGNIIKKISMNSKLPKSVQAMAFIANKSHTKNTHNKDTANFNIYGGHIVDLFYADGAASKPVDPSIKAGEYATAKANIFRDWAFTYNKLFRNDNTELKSSLSSRQIQKQMVSTIAHGTPSQVPKPSPAPRLLPLEMGITLDGISGIYQGNSLQFLTVQDGGVLPNRYKDQVIFQITKVQHSISDAGWDTNIKMMMRMTPAEDKKKDASSEPEE